MTRAEVQQIVLETLLEIIDEAYPVAGPPRTPQDDEDGEALRVRRIVDRMLDHVNARVCLQERDL